MRVGDPEPAARAKLPRLEPQLVAKLDQEVEHDRHRILVCAQSEDLGADVRVESDQLEARVPEGKFDRLARCPRFDREAKLGVQLARGDVIVSVRLDAR